MSGNKVRWKRRVAFWGVFTVLVLYGSKELLEHYGLSLPWQAKRGAAGIALADVPERKLKRTRVVPALDSPLNEAGNAVWCATFQVAWHKAKHGVVKQPLRVKGVQKLADRLNGSPVNETHLPPGGYYANAGLVQDGIEQTIRKEMAARFPHHDPPDLGGDDGFVAYAYLEAKAEFTTPFDEDPMHFRSADGARTLINGFKLVNEHGNKKLQRDQAKQVRVLYAETEDHGKFETLTGFALDLTADQDDVQLIVAVTERGESLAAMVQAVVDKTTALADTGHALDTGNGLEVPNVAFRTLKRFSALTGAELENPGFEGWPIVQATQRIAFVMDKSGAIVVSDAVVAAESAESTRHYYVDRPFLVIMKRRGAGQPYFVAWIENDELLDVRKLGS